MIYILSTVLVMRRERLLENVLLLTSPARRDQTRTIMETIWSRLGGYLRAKLIIMVAVGILMYASLEVLGVPFAVPLSVIVALGELVPKIGVWIARIPLLIIAAFQGWTTLGLTFLASYLIEDVKAYVLGPRVEGHALTDGSVAHDPRRALGHSSLGGGRRSGGGALCCDAAGHLRGGRRPDASRRDRDARQPRNSTISGRTT
jgi:hypothetical protein